MKTKLSGILIFSLLLNACANAAATPLTKATLTTTPVVAAKITATETATMEAATETSSPRKAVLSQVENTVSIRATQNDSPIPASSGMSIMPNGGVETGGDGRARIDLLPDGTIVRVGPNSSFTIPEITETDGKPSTTIDLLFGKIYILLNGGSLSVKTPTGTASVQGSVLSVEVDEDTGKTKASCLEGHCSLKDEKGNEVELTSGESSYIEDGEQPVEPEMIDNQEIEDWLDEVPEMPDFFDEMPDPEDFPEPEATSEPGATAEPQSTGEPESTSEPDASNTDGGVIDDTSGGGGDTGGGDSGGGDSGGGDVVP